MFSHSNILILIRENKCVIVIPFNLSTMMYSYSTFGATTETNPHADVPLPFLRMNADVLCNNDGRNQMANNGIPITVASENLKDRKLYM